MIRNASVNRLLTGILWTVLCLIPLMAAQTDGADAVLGKWLSSKGNNQVLIYRQGNQFLGKLVWMREPNDPATGKPKTDSHNPDEKLRSRPLMNLVLLTNMHYKGNNVWDGGQIYNPEDGKTYGCELILKDANIMDLHGYVLGMHFIGRTRTWTRVK